MEKAGNWEEQYIFVKERDLWNDDATERQMMVEEIDRRLEREKADRTAIGVLGLILFAFFGGTLFLQYGTDLFFEDLGIALFVQFAPNLVLLLGGGWLVSRRLRKKKERMLDGETVSARDTDWRGSRIRTMAVLAVGVLLIGWAVCIGQNQMPLNAAACKGAFPDFGHTVVQHQGNAVFAAEKLKSILIDGGDIPGDDQAPTEATAAGKGPPAQLGQSLRKDQFAGEPAAFEGSVINGFESRRQGQRTIEAETLVIGALADVSHLFRDHQITIKAFTLVKCQLLDAFEGRGKR